MLYNTLCIAGMSTKAIIALGALQYFSDNDLLVGVDKYIGTSSGAILCYLIIIGYTPAEILCYLCVNQVLEKFKHLNLVAMVNGGGATSWCRIQEVLEKMTIKKIGYLPTLQNLKEKFKKSLAVVTFNVTDLKTMLISSISHPNLPALVALRMTANLPFIFEKFGYTDKYFIDGAVGNNFPLDVAEKIGTKVIGLRVRNSNNHGNETNKGFLEYLYTLLMLPINEVERNHIDKKKESTDVYTIDTPFHMNAFHFNVPNTEKMDLFSFGYSEVRYKRVEKLQRSQYNKVHQEILSTASTASTARSDVPCRVRRAAAAATHVHTTTGI
jgi:predicted acylesterase/phospholipase RssA